MIKVGFDMLGERGSQRSQEKQSANCCAKYGFHVYLLFRC